jgi:tight adherence protein C
MEFVYAAVAFLGVFLIILAVALVALRWDPVSRRVRDLSPGGVETAPTSHILRWDETGKRSPQWRRSIERLGRLLLERSPEAQGARTSKVRQRLVWAGYDNPRNVLIFLGCKVALAGGFAYSYTLYGLAVKRVLPQVLLISAILAIIGFLLPDYWLMRKIKERQRLVQNALPDVLDLLVVCVEAGMGLDAAIAKVTSPDLVEVDTPLHRELRRVHLEFRAGRPRGEALHALGERTGVDDVRKIVAAFVQTEKLGTSMADSLRIHADAARVQRRLRAERAAYLAPLKMLPITVVFLFPPFLIAMALPPLLATVTAMFGAR